MGIRKFKKIIKMAQNKIDSIEADEIAASFLKIESEDSEVIDSLVMVKEKLSAGCYMLQRHDSEAWHLFSALAQAHRRNTEIDASNATRAVWGALTNDCHWIFAKLFRNKAGKLEIQLSYTNEMFKGRERGSLTCCADTKRCFEFIFSMVHHPSFDGTNQQNFANEALATLEQKLSAQLQRATKCSVESYRRLHPDTVHSRRKI